MGIKYKHFTREDRIRLQLLFDRRVSKKNIAKLMGFSLSSIYREIKRNRTKITIPPAHYYWCYRYDSFFADIKAKKRKHVQTLKLEKDKELRGYVFKKLKKGWSPKQIEGRLKRENNNQTQISHETIYKYIYKNWRLRFSFTKYLRRKRVSRLRHGQRVSKVPYEMLIRHRPMDINTRRNFGHWECDLMIFQHGKITSNLITLRERKTRYTLAIKNGSKRAGETAANIIRHLNKLGTKIKSITFDQGSEFFKYDWISKSLGSDIYFCDPASPEQKGCIENVNGVIRTKMPRSLNIGLISQSKIDKLINEINNRPMKCHNYETPEEKFSQELILNGA